MSANLKRGCGILLTASVVLLSILALLPDADINHDAGYISSEFIPLGTGLYRWFQKKWVLLIPLVMSVAIETTQYITGLGVAEFDDVFGNTMGGWIGVLAAWMWLSWKMNVKNRT